MRAEKFTPGQRATGAGAEFESGETLKRKDTTDPTGGQLTGAARWRHEKRQAAIWALQSLDPQDAAVICATVLDETGAGFPRLDYWGDTRTEADEWALLANAAELECYVASALKRLENQALGINARKRMFAALWVAFTDCERRAFLARVDADGTFHGKGAA